MLKAGALFLVVSIYLLGYFKVKQLENSKPYMKPTVKTRTTPIFRR